MILGIKTFYREASACLRVGGGLSESSYKGGSVTRIVMIW